MREIQESQINGKKSQSYRTEEYCKTAHYTQSYLKGFSALPIKILMSFSQKEEKRSKILMARKNLQNTKQS